MTISHHSNSAIHDRCAEQAQTNLDSPTSQPPVEPNRFLVSELYSGVTKIILELPEILDYAYLPQWSSSKASETLGVEVCRFVQQLTQQVLVTPSQCSDALQALDRSHRGTLPRPNSGRGLNFNLPEYLPDELERATVARAIHPAIVRLMKLTDLEGDYRLNHSASHMIPFSSFGMTGFVNFAGGQLLEIAAGTSVVLHEKGSGLPPHIEGLAQMNEPVLLFRALTELHLERDQGPYPRTPKAFFDYVEAKIVGAIEEMRPLAINVLNQALRKHLHQYVPNFRRSRFLRGGTDFSGSADDEISKLILKPEQYATEFALADELVKDGSDVYKTACAATSEWLQWELPSHRDVRYLELISQLSERAAELSTSSEQQTQL